ncbi:MAG: acyl-CoA dehydrogenase [Gammaproteobacteria bacterium]|nr:MAG: acyl-CoA dehydrogenase [Gammaproteobacteria bacterium]
MDTLNLILDSAERIFADHCNKETLDASEAGTFATALWQVLADNGLTLLGLSESGTTAADAYRVLRLAATHALPVPLGECVLARQLLEGAGSVEGLDGVGTLGRAAAGQGMARDVPWARDCDWILIAPLEDRSDGDSQTLTLLTAQECTVQHGINLAGEARDVVVFEAGAGRTVQCSTSPTEILEQLALLRVVQMAGCLARTLELSIEYAQDRVQFGRPISKFQAIQHQLAVLAGEVAAATRAADGALERLGDPRFQVQLAVAKARVGEAAGVAAEIAHQVHGAMGFTHEHQLHHYTRRLWAWRDEFGNEAHWQRQLGRRLAAVGADQVWDFITRH